MEIPVFRGLSGDEHDELTSISFEQQIWAIEWESAMNWIELSGSFPA